MITLFIICIVCWIIVKICNKINKKSNKIKEENLPLPQRTHIDLEVLTFNDQAFLDIFNRLKTIYYNGDIINYEQYKSFQNEIDNLKLDDKFGKELLSSLNFAISERDVQIGLPTSYLLLKPREEVYFQSPNSVIDKVKTILRNISFTGFRYNQGAFRSGNMYVTNKEVSGIARFDAGRFFATNQRLAFIGVNKHNFSIPLGNILSYAAYEKNGVIFNIANGKPIIVTFPFDEKFYNTHKEETGIIFHDDKVQLLYALDKVFELRNAA